MKNPLVIGVVLVLVALGTLLHFKNDDILQWREAARLPAAPSADEETRTATADKPADTEPAAPEEPTVTPEALEAEQPDTAAPRTTGEPPADAETPAREEPSATAEGPSQEQPDAAESQRMTQAPDDTGPSTREEPTTEEAPATEEPATAAPPAEDPSAEAEPSTREEMPAAESPTTARPPAEPEPSTGQAPASETPESEEPAETAEAPATAPQETGERLTRVTPPAATAPSAPEEPSADAESPDTAERPAAPEAPAPQEPVAPAEPPATAEAPAETPDDGDATAPDVTEQTARAPSATAPPAPDEDGEKSEDSAAGQPPAGDVQPPSFDIVRVEEDGTAVIAGRATPGTQVQVLLDDEVIATTTANSRGEWVVLVEKPIPPGDHQLSATAASEGGPTVASQQSVALAVPESEREEPLIVATEPGAPSRVLQSPPESADQPAARDLQLTLGTVDYNDSGDILFSGQGLPGAVIRLYVDNRMIDDIVAGSDGRWRFAGREEIAPGSHMLRLDQLDANGNVVRRIELPFVRAEPEQVAELALQRRNAEEGSAYSRRSGESRGRALITLEGIERAIAPGEPEADATADPVPPEESEEAETAAAPEPSPEAAAPVAPEQPAAPEAPGETVAPAPAPAADAAPGAAQPADEAGTGGAAQAVAPTDPQSMEELPEAARAAAASGKGFVIIQPGNNLWRISRVIYGRGIEYTVIYQANKEQIRDPDLIYPGQVFTTPGVAPPYYIPPDRRAPLGGDEAADTGSRGG